MAERVPPSTASDNIHRHRGPLGEGIQKYEDQEMDIIHHSNNNNVTMQIVSSANNEGRPHETYIIQIPKDQIYRVPPPENARIVEQHQKPVQNKRRSKRCVCYFISAFLVIAFIISVIVCVHRFTLSPKPPVFSVRHLVVKPPAKKHGATMFTVTVGTVNPNSVNDISYEEGKASLKYKGKEVAKGKYPSLDKEESGKSDSVDVVLHGSSKGVENLPHDDNNKKNKKKKKNKPIGLDLSMSIPVKMKSWLWTKTVDLNVGCVFEVSSLENNAKVELQKCDIQT